MGKASSNKKVARAAKAGGGRARAAGERNLVFPVSMVAVVALGVALVVYARDDRLADALVHPVAFEDHWHSAYGIYACDTYLPNAPEFEAPQNGGTHTHGDGLLHIHPFSTARAGENATLNNYFQDAGAVLGGGDAITDDAIGVPGGETYTEGETVCEGVEGDPVVQVLVWQTGQEALDGDDPEVVTENFDDIRFEQDGMVFAVVFAPEGTEVEAPPSTGDLGGVGSDLGVTPESVPEDVDLSDIGGDTSSTTEAGTDESTPTTEDTTTEDTTATTEDTTADEPTSSDDTSVDGQP